MQDAVTLLIANLILLCSRYFTFDLRKQVAICAIQMAKEVKVCHVNTYCLMSSPKLTNVRQ